MLSRFLSGLLALAVLVCPLWCRFGLCAVGETSDSPAAHCPCCEKRASVLDANRPPDSKSDGHPAPHHPGDQLPRDSSCQCVCGGAIVDKHEPLTIHVERANDVLPLVPSSPLSGDVQDRSAADWLPRHGPAAFGRMVRAWLMSYLC